MLIFYVTLDSSLSEEEIKKTTEIIENYVYSKSIDLTVYDMINSLPQVVYCTYKNYPTENNEFLNRLSNRTVSCKV